MHVKHWIDERKFMKKILILFSLITSFNSYASLSLKCSQNLWDDGHVGFEATKIFNCKDFKGNEHTVIFRDVGPGLLINDETYAVMTCPTVSKKRLERKGLVNLGSVKVSAAVIGGVEVAIAANLRGGACLLTGVNIGIGVSVLVGRMSIYTETGLKQAKIIL